MASKNVDKLYANTVHGTSHGLGMYNTFILGHASLGMIRASEAQPLFAPLTMMTAGPIILYA